VSNHALCGMHGVPDRFADRLYRRHQSFAFGIEARDFARGRGGMSSARYFTVVQGTGEEEEEEDEEEKNLPRRRGALGQPALQVHGRASPFCPALGPRTSSKRPLTRPIAVETRNRLVLALISIMSLASKMAERLGSRLRSRLGNSARFLCITLNSMA